LNVARVQRRKQHLVESAPDAKDIEQRVFVIYSIENETEDLRRKMESHTDSGRRVGREKKDEEEEKDIGKTLENGFVQYRHSPLS